jgi:hypothetical protein
MLKIQTRWATQVVIVVILLTSFALAQEKISVADIIQNPERYDGKTIIVEGKIISYRERFSRRGNPYTTFSVRGWWGIGSGFCLGTPRT